MSPRVRLIIAATLVVGWLGWLGFTALTKSRAPVVSRAQAAGATVSLLVEMIDGEEGREVLVIRSGVPENVQEKAYRPAVVVKVVERFTSDGPEAGTQIGIINLPMSAGYTGPGQYLLLLNRDESSRVGVEIHPAYKIAGQQRSPGADHTGGPWVIYPWSQRTDSDLRKQLKKLFP